MTTPTPEQKGEIFAAIEAHLRVYGAKDWHLVRDQWPDIIGGAPGSATERKFFRWVKSVQGGRVPESTKENARKAARAEAIKDLPAAPSPQYLTAHGAKARQNIDFLAALSRLYGDADMLREKAMKTGPDGVEEIKIAPLFSESIKRRLDVLTQALKVMQAVYDLEYMKDFYEEIIKIVVEVVGDEHPEMQREIMVRMAALNDRHNMTMHAGRGG
jgi:hypothetical protein